MLAITGILLISLFSFAGAFFLFFKKKLLDGIIIFLVSLSAGTLLGGAFLHLLPEAIEQISPDKVFLITLFAFIFFFLIEKFLSWHHCHRGDCSVHEFGTMNLLGDAVHNFIDGVIIGVSFSAGRGLGLASLVAIALHELPQEIGDFGVLIHSGFTRKKALAANFATALTAVLGGLLGLLLSSVAKQISLGLLPFAAGGFIYIAASDLIPEIKKEAGFKRSLVGLLVFVAGILLMMGMKYLLE